MAATSKAKTDDELAEVVMLMANGLNLKQACAQAGVGYANTVKRIGESEQLTKLHAHAREAYVFHRVDAMHEIALNEPDVQRAKLRTSLIQWEAARILPKQFGEHKSLEVATVKDLNTMTSEEIDARLAELLAKTGMGLVRLSDITDVEGKSLLD